MEKERKGYEPKWTHVRIHASALAEAAGQAARLANGPAADRTFEAVTFTAEIVERSADMLALIAAAVEADPKLPKGVPKAVDVPAVVVPPLVEGGCRVLHGLAIATAEAADEAARLGSSKAAAFAPGAMRAVAEKVKKLTDVWEAPTSASAAPRDQNSVFAQ